jgi:hypothetical protein
MHIPTWRFLLTGTAVAVLAIGGIGLVAATSAPPSPAPNVTMAQATGGPDTTRDPDVVRPDREVARERLERAREAWGGGRLLRWGRHLVHAEVTVTGRDGELITLAFDHGTVAAVGGGSITIAETGGGTETVTIDDATVVYVGREDGDLDDLNAGDEVFVHSRVGAGATLAKRILIVPASAN